MGTTGLKRWLDEAGVRPSRRMGQCFLVDGSILDRIAGEARSLPGECLVEIGAGPGNLTERIADGSRPVVALERDRRLAALCGRRLSGRPGLTVIAGDALALPLRRSLRGGGRIAVAGNIPYSITGEIVRTLAEDHPCVARAALLVQEEVASRLAARPGSREYGAFTVLTGARFDVARRLDVPASAFHPRPEVDSTLIVLSRPDDARVDPALFPLMRSLVQEAFRRRRKTLENAVGPFLAGRGFPGGAAPAIAAAGLDPRQRPETVALEGWVALAREAAAVAG